MFLQGLLGCLVENFFIVYFLICLCQGGIGHKDGSISQICTDCFIEINTYTYIIVRLHKFDSQLHCTIQLNNRKTWTKYMRLKPTLHDMHHNETNVKSHSDSGGKVSQYHIQQSVITGRNDAPPE